MRTVLELSLLFTLAIVSVSYALVRDELLELKLQCHSYGYAKISVDELGAVESIKLKKPDELRTTPASTPRTNQDQMHFVKIEQNH
ncbi:hypothetical protein [uncultured Gimesia sp.]|uniref:hypothetical protein n=1 Tax=uncultured Gimesia sp. TaxID=1678688 RepID=UPI002613C468|nr:hypothetical protein [uncultured Gimesia sp.]